MTAPHRSANHRPGMAKLRGFIRNCLLALLLVGPSAMVAADLLPLAGEWQFALDPRNEGLAQEWFKTSLADTVRLPGTISENHKGPRAVAAEKVVELSDEYPYAGLAWYQRTIHIPEDWGGRMAELFLERTRMTKVWLDDDCLGEQDALGVAQVYPLPGLSPGAHRLTIRVDSRTVPFGVSGHMVNTSTQTRWNGLLGELHLAAHDPVWTRQARVVSDIREKAANVLLSLGNATEVPQRGHLTLSAAPFNVPEATGRRPLTTTCAFTVSPGGGTVSCTLAIGKDALLWDEFHPALYRLVVSLETETNGARQFQHAYRDEFGLREFRATGTQFTINGRTTQLRGKHDAMVFPLLGHVAMDLDEWTRVLTVAKSYGINHYRFHTCTPPEAAFQAADRLGLYLQPELYNGSYRDEKAMTYSLTEAKRILTAYVNHPSFVMLSLGNEMWEGRENRAKTVAELRNFDSTRSYAQGSNNEFGRPTLAAGDDYWTSARTSKDSADHAVRGSFSHADLPLGHIQRLRPNTRYDYRGAIAGVPVPVIGHEVGQFEVFPDFREIPKYTGVQKPWNLATFRSRLQAAGMLDQADAFVAASGALAVRGYRADIETALRTPGFGGFQLLDLQDFPGQGTALVGILNAFMDSKGLITPEAWRHFCGPIVPLARMDSYTWTQGQVFSAQIEVAQYGPKGLKGIPLPWELRDTRGRSVARGMLPARDYPQGRLVPAGEVTVPLAKLPAPARYDLRLSLSTTDYENEYPLWVYPDAADTTPPASCVISQGWDSETQSLLRAGKSVLLFPPPESVKGVEGFFTTDYWCYPMFRSICEGGKKSVAPGTMGLLIDASHPALAAFPTESHSDWQWWDLVMGSRALVLDATPAQFRPIVQDIDNFERNHKLGFLLETRVDKGALLVCTLNLLHKQESPVARQMLHSLMNYARAGLQPKSVLPLETVNALFATASPIGKQNPDPSFRDYFEKKP